MRPLRKHQGQDGTSFFVTTVTHDRAPVFRDPKAASLAQKLIHTYNQRGDFWLSEYVVMPDHLHLLISPRSHPLSHCMQMLKRTISDEIHVLWGRDISAPQNRSFTGKTFPLWQPSFHDMIIRSNEQRDALRNYLLQNPVKAGLCEEPEDYPFSSIHRKTDRHHLSVGAHYPDAKPPLLIATSNLGKVREISEVLAEIPLDVLTPIDLPYIEEQPEESGSTFKENATEKSRFYFERSGLPTVADDSGIVVEALEDELGIHTRRWGAGPSASDEEWIDFFLKRMRKEKNKRARFVCVLVYIDPLGAPYTFEGHCEGIITPTLEADYLPGLPISACFKPTGHERVFSALSTKNKNTISHRGIATQKFKKFFMSS